MYSLTLNKHITINGLYTDEEMDYFDHLEKEHKESLPQFSQYQLMQIFPEALDYIKEKINILEMDREYDRNKINKAHFKLQAGLIKKHDLYYDNILLFYKKFLPVKTTGGGITDSDINRAKEIPISDFITIKHGFANCPLHEDKTPSLKLYKNNSWYCFSCHEGGTVIDLVMKMQGLKFLEAVKMLMR